MALRINPRVLDRIRYEQEIRSDTALAEQLGIDRSTLARWRNGDSSPEFKHIALIVTKYNIPFEDMLRDEDTPQTTAA